MCLIQIVPGESAWNLPDSRQGSPLQVMLQAGDSHKYYGYSMVQSCARCPDYSGLHYSLGTCSSVIHRQRRLMTAENILRVVE